MKTIKIGDILVNDGIITIEQLMNAIKLQKESPGKRLGTILIELQYISESQMLLALSRRVHMDVYDSKTDLINSSAVKAIPKKLSVKHLAVCIELSSTIAKVLINDPLNFYAQEDVSSILQCNVKFILATKQQIIEIITNQYSEMEMSNAISSAKNLFASEINKDVTVIVDGREDAPIVNLINKLLNKGVHDLVSDIHIEPFEKKTNVRMRVDGLLINYLDLESGLHQSIVSRIKVLANLDIAEKRVPQDGHFKFTSNEEVVNVRVSTLPTIYGEKVVMRLLLKNKNLDYSETFGMNFENYNTFKSFIKRPHGIIYLTGPTGSGKTTTLYMILEELAKGKVNISTVEDPVEQNILGINQSQVNPVAGLTFESGLRSLLRQDPDIIMVGETRDNETAKTAVSAALTGHLVFSTLHTNDSISTIVRLADMGVEPYMIGSSLAGVVAQRLVKKICPVCKREHLLTADEKKRFPHLFRTFEGKGCSNCNFTGYKGRIAIHEIFELDSVIANMVTKKEPIDNIYRYARDSKKMKFLQDDVAQLLADGQTTIDEYNKIAPLN